MLYALEREWLPLYKFDQQTHRRLSFRLDDRHPVGASHHQKVVVIDDSVAFVGGFDLTRARWDTPAHESAHPLRVDSTGKPYGPFHDVAAVVDGDCARALGELARERWQRATGRSPSRRARIERDDAWPAGVEPALRDVAVGISRTVPGDQGHEAISEIRTLHLDAIAAARHAIYAENQYFTSRTISGAFTARLAAADAPEIAVVSPGDAKRLAGGVDDGRAARAHPSRDQGRRCARTLPALLPFAAVAQARGRLPQHPQQGARRRRRAPDAGLRQSVGPLDASRHRVQPRARGRRGSTRGRRHRGVPQPAARGAPRVRGGRRCGRARA